MSLFEMMGDNDPKNIGTIEKNQINAAVKLSAGLLVKAFFSALLIGFGEFLVLTSSHPLAGSIILGLYLVLANLVNPKPNNKDYGLLGGLVDHPFKYTDDINRFLLFLKLFLWPGKQTLGSVIMLIHALKNRWISNKR